MRFSLIALCAALPFVASCVGTETAVSVIPRPQEVESGRGIFKTGLNDSLLSEFAVLPVDSLSRVMAGYGVNVSVRDSVDGVTSEEGYVLDVRKSGASIEAEGGAGIFYALQTMRQLVSDGGIAEVRIVDNPRFGYRGLHFDVSRHFRSKEFIMKQMDAMARYKLNTFHWHLTDGAGWRLEIDGWPLLTEVAAYRPYDGWKQWWNGGRRYCTADTPGAEGGFYTKEDVKEVLEYARQRHITVIPEIEMPGHSEEVLAVYPELSCTGKPYESSEFCIGKEATFRFVESVLDEVMEMFPSEYIHIGGDEASREHWKKCPDCQRRMRKEGLANEDELQSYMIKRVEKYLNDHGRKLLGWDEILLGGVSPTATVMVWRGTDFAVQAARSGNDVIMTPGEFCYLDAYQDAPHTQPEAIGGYLTLEKVYSFRPVPDSLDASEAARYKGVQGNVWTEYIPTEEHAEYMMYPRLLALAEIAWSPEDRLDWDSFYGAVVKETDYLKSAGYNPFDIRNQVGERPQAREKVEHLAVGAGITYRQPFSRYYPAGGDSALVDGVRGGWTYADKRWQGFINRDVDVVIDLGEVREVSYVGAEFMQLTGPYLWQPAEVIISFSNDSTGFREVVRTKTDVPEDASGLIFRTYEWIGRDSARFVRYNAVSNRRPGGCLFTDEIIVR